MKSKKSRIWVDSNEVKSYKRKGHWRNPEEEKAVQIIKDIKSKTIQFRPTNDVHIQLCNFFGDVVHRYDRSKIMTIVRAREIIRAYNQAEFYGLVYINKDEEKEALKKEVLRLNKKLAEYEKSDKPSDTVYSDIQEE